MKRALVVSCIIVLGAIVGGCGKKGSESATAASGASASEAPVQPVQGASDAAAASGAQKAGPLGAVTKKALPAEAADTLRLIKAGGPYPYGEDGVLFRNSALMLPEHPRGYYRAYTVRTPGATDRGQRRIVCGGARKQIKDCYYTEDYYASFKRISE
ncbi:exported ribonuclease [Caballeronia hypogeia]|uniref:Exported ribonuclease n=1 Tax=Caballeronia hypogeia TaxID=1777140 RepID=A0A158BUK4_9BURK|nr:ribonuclease [Caballeronia hypogeia]SAK73660.1 exported ribonuclease [Caballeronia hypogeia]